MLIYVNAKLVEIDGITQIKPLLNHLGFNPCSIAVAIDGEHILREDYDQVVLIEGTKLDIIAPMVGG